MSRQYDHWIHSQLEPTDILRTGNAKRFKPAWVEKNEGIEKMRKELGEAKFQEMLADEQLTIKNKNHELRN